MAESFGWLGQYPGIGWSIFVIGIGVLGFLGAKLYLWSLFLVAAFWLLGVPPLIFIPIVVVLAAFNFPPLRRRLMSRPIMKFINQRGIMPPISATERVVIESGTSWVDAELFSGKPHFDKIRAEAYPDISPTERAFIDHQVRALCALTTDWEIFQNGELPPHVWDYIKREGFLGMIIPRQYGGLNFSARGHSEVVALLASHSFPLAISVAVPNSLGPAELIIHYGTDQQKEYYLPRLASGEEIPCFALTEPGAGSDAGSLNSSAEVFASDDGKLYLRMNWNKRYITLASISTIMGLAVRLYDPKKLLGLGQVDLGITCVLVPSRTKGVVLGRRHNPMGVPFHNCPTSGHDVIVSVDQIIGGVAGAGKGWSMLMECLATGRAISMPAQSVGGVRALAWLTSTYAAIRRQFGVAIGRFEGIEEPIARIAGLSYMMDAARVFVAGAVDAGVKPSVASAISKAYITEICRKLVSDGMDIMGGAGISRGPRNRIANAYIGAPISITVEGANILTRTLIIFGQGTLRCHPYAYREILALETNDVKAFDSAFCGHIGHVVRNSFRAVLLGLSRGYLARVPSGPSAKYYRKIAWASASFAILADIAMAAHGGKLRQKEKITGRFADVLSYMYLAMATIKRFETEASIQTELRDVFDWSMQYAMTQIQQGFEGILVNLELPWFNWIFRSPLALAVRLNPVGTAPTDRLGHRIARALQRPTTIRETLTKGIIRSTHKGDIGELLEQAFYHVEGEEALWTRIKKAPAYRSFAKKEPQEVIKLAFQAGIINAAEAEFMEYGGRLQENVLAVDSFTLEELRPTLQENGRTEDAVFREDIPA